MQSFRYLDDAEKPWRLKVDTLIGFSWLKEAKVMRTKMSQRKFLDRSMVSICIGDWSVLSPELNPVSNSTVLRPNLGGLGSVSVLPSDSDFGRFSATNFGRQDEYIPYFDSVPL